ncbi:hypothetical protein ACLB2K_066301 [Fragaria x ananassa]
MKTLAIRRPHFPHSPIVNPKPQSFRSYKLAQYNAARLTFEHFSGPATTAAPLPVSRPAPFAFPKLSLITPHFPHSPILNPKPQSFRSSKLAQHDAARLAFEHFSGPATTAAQLPVSRPAPSAFPQLSLIA